MNETLSALIHKRPLFNVLEAASKQFQMSLLHFYREPDALRVIQEAFRVADLQMNPLDAYSLYSLVRMQATVPGSIAEIGMYRGGSARIICHLKGDKKFYGFDTFQGLPKPRVEDEKWFTTKQFQARKDAVAACLADFKNVELIEGLFPESGAALNGERLSFVNLDVDLYQGMISSLNFIWEKMSTRGMVLIHDCHLAGVKKAVTEFLQTHTAMVFDAGCSQTGLIRP